MSLLQSILMGVIQGLTEFLPVSSSGHLAIFKILFHVDTDTGLLFDVLLHIGTLIAVFVVYYRDIIRLIRELVLLITDCFHNIAVWIGRHRGQHGKYRRIIHNSYRKLVLMIFVSTIPTGVIGYVGRDFVEAASGILLIPGICLMITSGLLFISDFAPDGTKKPRQGDVCQRLYYRYLPGNCYASWNIPFRNDDYRLCTQRFRAEICCKIFLYSFHPGDPGRSGAGAEGRGFHVCVGFPGGNLCGGHDCGGSCGICLY